MILVLGASGYVGKAFAHHFERTNAAWQGVSRDDCDYYNPQKLVDRIRGTKAEFLINCAGFSGKPNVDSCEDHKAECLLANGVLPGLISTACREAGIPWGHVSSGCIYTGEPADRPSGFTEDDDPNFSFRQNNCSFYSGCKALGEECLDADDQCYIWRLRIPFNEVDGPRNYISKMLRYERLLNARNSLSQIDEFVIACHESWVLRIPFGVYNLTNGGSTTTREVIDLIGKHGISSKAFDFFDSEEEFMKLAARTPRSNTVLDNSKALKVGLKLTAIDEALERALKKWKPTA